MNSFIEIIFWFTGFCIFLSTLYFSFTEDKSTRKAKSIKPYKPIKKKAQAKCEIISDYYDMKNNKLLPVPMKEIMRKSKKSTGKETIQLLNVNKIYGEKNSTNFS